MSKIRFTNNAESFLSAAIDAEATAFSVDSGTGALFPALSAGQSCFVRIGADDSNEVVTVTARSSDTFTCAATAGAWAAGSPVILPVCAEVLDGMAQAVGGGQVLQDHELRDYAETLSNPTISSGALVLDYSAANVFAVTLTAAVTSLTISNPPASGKAGSFTLILSQDATGGRAFTWPAAVTWAGGEAPDLTTTANGVDVLVFITVDGGTTWRGMLAGAAFA